MPLLCLNQFCGIHLYAGVPPMSVSVHFLCSTFSVTPWKRLATFDKDHPRQIKSTEGWIMCFILIIYSNHIIYWEIQLNFCFHECNRIKIAYLKNLVLNNPRNIFWLNSEYIFLIIFWFSIKSHNRVRNYFYTGKICEYG